MIFYPCYFQANNEKKPKKCTAKGKLVKSKRIDYANIMWPRDGLYVCYKEQVPFINYVNKEMVGWVGNLLSLLRISIFYHFGSTSFVLPIRPKNSILNRVIRVETPHRGTSL